MARDRFGMESSLIVPVPAAEPVVGPWRQNLDPACGWGVPAHITVLYPFVPPADIDQGVLDRLRRVLDETPAFAFRLVAVEWFGDEVAWVRPEPARLFLDLTARVEQVWPEYLPYEGAHAEVIPHLTICRGADPDDMAAAAAGVDARLPLDAEANRVHLMKGTRETDSWTTVAEFPLQNG